MNTPKIVGKVDFHTGLIYDLKGNIIPKNSYKSSESKEEIAERLERRRLWLSGISVY